MQHFPPVSSILAKFRGVPKSYLAPYESKPFETEWLRYICFSGVLAYSTHVKVGETNICDHCSDRPGEQTIQIKRWERDLTEKSDIAFILLTHLIKFNHKVRPACLLRQPYKPTRGWFAHYGKPDNCELVHIQLCFLKIIYVYP